MLWECGHNGGRIAMSRYLSHLVSIYRGYLSLSIYKRRNCKETSAGDGPWVLTVETDKDLRSVKGSGSARNPGSARGVGSGWNPQNTRECQEFKEC